MLLQIADFGMACDVTDDNFYLASGGKVSIKWTAPEVYSYNYNHMAFLL